jgi:hypothetical protein
MNTLVYIYVPHEFVIGQVVLKSFIKRIVVAIVNKTVSKYFLLKISASDALKIRLCATFGALDAKGLKLATNQKIQFHMK